MRTPNRSRFAWAAAPLLCVLPLIAWVADAADAADAAAAPAATGTTKDQLQEVVVTGIRANLEKSLDVKKLAPVVLDSINSTELGRFPDADVGDALAHLPGITLERTTGGEGQSVRIRGLDRQYNIITLNNRILPSDDDGRDLAFDLLPAELITGADVLK
ncbi:MAG: TonB-dependent receptor plug domain-containing protein, partial [Gammaproteobacteria bacterium]|nr:TonB-dependent receptor plug domain-containing protein [Gammaproteobacteria bacterium]